MAKNKNAGSDDGAGAEESATDPSAETALLDKTTKLPSEPQQAGPDDETVDYDDSHAAHEGSPKVGSSQQGAPANGDEGEAPTATLATATGAGETADSEALAEADAPEIDDDEAPAPCLDIAEGSVAASVAAFHRVRNPDGMAFALVMSIAAAMTLPFLGSMGFFDPWESHYAEVARSMVERDDYLYPHWKSQYFFSKPVLLFWATAPLYRLIGAGHATGELPAATEFCGRLPVALISLFTVAVIWFAARRLWGRRAATLSAIVLSTTPFWALISRQAITDMYYVGPMSSAIALLAVAFFDEDRERLEKARIPWWMLAFLAVCLFPQLWEIGRSGAFLHKSTLLGSEFATRIAFSAFLCALAAGFLALLRVFARDPLVHMAAALCAIATLGKGPHALVFTWMPFFFYFVASGEWRRLGRWGLLSAIAVYFFIAAPWPTTMFFFDGKDGGKTWFQRFVLYDLFGRLGGVHGNRGTHEYYVRYFAFGTQAWAALMPLAVVSAMTQRLKSVRSRLPSDRFELLCVFWSVGLFIFFTATNTKFHHYIFPVTIPCALLLGRWLDRSLLSPHRIPLGIAFTSVLVVLAIGRDLVIEPWQIADLFTYHYVSYKPSYYFPTDLWWRVSLGVALLIAVLFFVFGVFSDWMAEIDARGRNGSAVGGPESASAVSSGASAHDGGGYGVFAFFSQLGRAVLVGTGRSVNGGFVLGALLGAFVLAVYLVHGYQLKASQHWSHRQLLHTYWELKQPGDKLVSYQMDWKGETFYSHNTEKQIKKSASQLKKTAKQPGRTFVLVQQDRFKRIESAVGKEHAARINVIDRSNKKWFLVLIDELPKANAKAKPKPKPKPAQAPVQKAETPPATPASPPPKSGKASGAP